ncbi:WD40 repeat domain-containing protein [Neptunomonas phycophila]|uniref:WD40 repeat domain-containing protein n=1 Tax=Neptunomonas phycophila TaxID=1572645 RepID=UPI00094911E8|nr:WD40 repeat domain-containing protein [Neptunomonas phycophila]QLE99305.1 WD40 repeat domain-containing protein [Neptunomonas phycophila]
MKYLASLLLATSLVSTPICTAQAEPIAQFEISNISNNLFSFSPDGAVFASIVDVDKVPQMELHNSETGELITRSTQSVSGTFSPAWTSDGHGLYTEGGGQEQMLHWDGKKWNLLDLKGIEFGLFSFGRAELSADATMLSVDNFKTDISIVRLANQSWQLLDTQEEISDLAIWSPDGRYLATGHGGTVILWDAKKLHEVRRFEGLVPDNDYNRFTSIDTLDWSPSGQYLAIGTPIGNGYLVDLENTEADPIDLLGDFTSVSQLQWVLKTGLFWQEQEVLIYKASNEKVHEDHLLWYDPEDNDVIYDHMVGPQSPLLFIGGNFLVQTLIGSGKAVVQTEMPDLVRQISINYISVIEPDGNSVRKKLPDNFRGMAISPDGRFIVIREYVDNRVQKASLWDFDTFMDEL